MSEEETSEDTNLEIWNKFKKTNPKFTKDFHNGSFSGTAIQPLYNIFRATKEWGPPGGKWGYDEIRSYLVETTGVWVSQVQVWVNDDDGNRVASVVHWGGTKMKYQTKGGYEKIDDDAPKKSLTDALSKALSILGFSADVHLDLFDEVKYVSD